MMRRLGFVLAAAGLMLMPAIASAQTLSLPDGTVTADTYYSGHGLYAWWAESVTTLTIDAENLGPGQHVEVSGKITGLTAPTTSWAEIGLIPKDMYDYWQTAFGGGWKPAVFDKGLYVVHWDSSGLALGLQEGWDDRTSTTYHNKNGGTQPFAWPLDPPTVPSAWDFTFTMDPEPDPSESYLSVVGADMYGTQPFPYGITDGEPVANDNDYSECYLIAQIWSTVANGSFSFTDVQAVVVFVPPTEVWVDDDWNNQDDVDLYNPSLTWQYDAFNSIQDGVDAVSGSIVHVLPGTYEEQVVIPTNDVEVIGAGSGNDPAVDSIIQSPASLTYFFGTNYPIVGVHDATGVSIENLRVDGLGRGNGNYRFVGIAFWNAGGDVIDCAVTRICETPHTGAQHGVGIYAYNGDDGPYTVNVTGSTVDDYQKNGMALNGTNLTANVSECTTTGWGPTAITAQNGIQLGWGAGGTVEGCTVSDHMYTGAGWASTGVLLYQCTSVDVTETVITDNLPGVYCQDSNATFDAISVSNQDANSGDGFYAYNTTGSKGRDAQAPRLDAAPFAEADRAGSDGRTVMTASVSNSSFVGHDKADSWGVSAFASGADAVNLSLSCSTVKDWDYGVVAYDDGGPVALTAHNNSIVSNVSYGFYSYVTNVQDALNSWWGAASGPSGEGSGSGDAVSTYVDYDPWLTSPINALVLEADDCQDDVDAGTAGVQIKVELWMRNVCQDVTGYTAFMQFDDTKLTFVSGTYTNTPFPHHVPAAIGTLAAPDDDIVEAGGYMQLGDPDWPGVQGDALLATLVFTVVDECETTGLTLVSFAVFESELSFEGVPVPTELVDTPVIQLDDTPPVITCPDPYMEMECCGKTHFPQLPDEEGWDVNATWPKVLADDWLCLESGPVKYITFWGSWKGDLVGTITSFHLSIHANIPGLPSMPAIPALWTYEAYDFGIVPATPNDPPTMQGWYDPNPPGEVIENDHQAYFRYKVVIPDTYPPFEQVEGIVYWLDISAVVAAEPPDCQWGWKTSVYHFMDDAVWADDPDYLWQPLEDPITYETLDLAFRLTASPGVGPGPATAIDNCDLDPVLTFTDRIVPGACPQAWSITRTWTATDYCGNTDTCDQVVDVVDTTPPTITCPDDVLVNTDSGVCSATGVDLGTPTVDDNCSVPTVTNDASEPYALGNTTVTWTATDGCGNTATCTQTVTVVDNELPTITCPTDVTVDTDAGLCTASGVALGTPTTDDNCSVASVTNDATEPYALGDTTVTWTVTDGSGNTATCTQTVTVEDNELPTITCPPDVTVNADAGLCTASGVDLGTPTTDDNCSVASVTNDATEPYALGDTTVTWTVTDGSGNTATCTQTVTVLAYNDVVGVVVELQGVDAGDWPDPPLTRCIKFIAKNGTTCATAVHVWVEFYGAPAIGTAPTFQVDCGDWDELCAKDEQHTLYDTVDLADAGTFYEPTDPVGDPLYLLAGDTDNDSDVDIHDVTWLMYQWGLGAGPAAFGDCPWDGTRDADFSNDNVFTGTDYLLLSGNWHAWTVCDCGTLPGGGGHDGLLLAEASVLASELPWEMAESVDLNRDGVVDYQDVREFEVLHGLPNTLSTQMKAATRVAEPAKMRLRP